MHRHSEIQCASPLVRQHEEDIQDLKPDRRNDEEATEAILFTWFARNVLQVWDCGLLPRSMYLLTQVSPISIPSLSSSPWIRGAPQTGLSRLILRIKPRTSFGTAGRPSLPH
jgi:hypothetical protein